MFSTALLYISKQWGGYYALLLFHSYSIVYFCDVHIVMSPAHDITYLDPFLGARTGSLYITDYKMYFKSPSDEKVVSSLSAHLSCLCVSPVIVILIKLAPNCLCPSFLAKRPTCRVHLTNSVLCSEGVQSPQKENGKNLVRY